MIAATSMIQVDMTGIMQGQFELIREMITEIIVMMLPYALGIVGLMVIVTVAKGMFMKFVSNIHPEGNTEYGQNAPEMLKYDYPDGFEDIYAAREEGDWEDYDDDDITKDRSSPYYGYTYDDYLRDQPEGVVMPPEEYDWYIKNEGEYPGNNMEEEHNNSDQLSEEEIEEIKNMSDEDFWKMLDDEHKRKYGNTPKIEPTEEEIIAGNYYQPDYPGCYWAEPIDHPEMHEDENIFW